MTVLESSRGGQERMGPWVCAVEGPDPRRKGEETMSHDGALVEELDSMVSERSLLRHPFYQQWTAGTLSLGRLRDYAAQYYRHVAAFPRYLSAIHARCEDLETRQMLLENLIDEERGAENHPELWLRFAEALGLGRDAVFAAAALPGTRALVDTFARLSREASVGAALAALYVYETQTPAVATAKIDGLRRFYGVADARSLAFFTVHQCADVDHARAVAELVSRHSTTAAEQGEALEAAASALDSLWAMLDGV